MPRPQPHTIALALVVANFVSQLRIPQRRQRIRGNELPFARCEALRIPTPAVIPLPRRSARLIDSRREHSLHVCRGSSQRLPQVIFRALAAGQRDQLPVPGNVDSRDPPRLPIPSLQQSLPGGVLGHYCGLFGLVLHLLHWICALIGFGFSRLYFCRRIRRFVLLWILFLLGPWCLSGLVRRSILLSLTSHDSAQH